MPDVRPERALEAGAVGRIEGAEKQKLILFYFSS